MFTVMDYLKQVKGGTKTFSVAKQKALCASCAECTPFRKKPSQSRLF